MLRFTKNCEEGSPAMLLSLYNILSLFVLMSCIVIMVFINTLGYLKEERQRADISFQQLKHFFDFQYRATAEELWTRNYEAISMRVSEIAKKFGNAKYQLYLIGIDGGCLGYSSSLDNYKTACSIPKVIKQKLKKYNFENSHRMLAFDLSLNKYIYSAELNIEPRKLGFIYAEVSDPYSFYRGTLLEKLSKELILKLIAIAIIWLLWLLISRRLILKPYFKYLRKSEKREALGGLAAQVAHDIRSPLAVLDMITQVTSKIPEDNRILIRRAVGRISDIANNLLETYRNSVNKDIDKTNLLEEPFTCQIAVTLIESILAEKRLQFQSKVGVIIEEVLHDEENYGLFIKVQLSNFKRAISNIINNSIEAIKGAGSVTLNVKQGHSLVEVAITDTGIGMSPDLINKIGESGGSFGKLNGHGLGLFHAKKVLSNCKGQLIINSKLNQGTTVSILLPKENQPSWFIRELNIFSDSAICVIDDDDSIHHIWNRRLHKYNNLPSPKSISFFSFSSPNDFIHWREVNQSFNQKILYLCDYEFIEKEINGIELIKKLEIESSSVLVTSNYEDCTIQSCCAQYGIKLLPKSMAAFIPIKFLDTGV